MHKSDGDHPVLPAGDNPVAGMEKNEFDDAITSAIAGETADATSNDRADGALTNGNGKAPDESASPKPTDDEALEPGFVLRDRFEIVALVHSGGMGHVYKAIDSRRPFSGSDQVHVAIKMIRRSVAPKIDARLVLAREAAKAQCLSHPNIINIYDFDQHDEQFYLVMEWLQGESVNELLRRTSGRQLAPQYAWRVIQGVAAGMQHAHSNNVVHADINPSNIFVTDTQDIKLLDFGVARSYSTLEDATDVSFAWATRSYASPEVLSGSRPIFEDDIFSLACVAYRLLSGTHPFRGKSSIEAKEAGATVQPIASLAKSDWRTLSRALSYARSERPRTVDAFLPDLVAASSPGFAGRSRSRPATRWLLVVPAAAAALLLSVWWLRQTGPQDEPPEIATTTSVDDKSTGVTTPVDDKPTVAAEPTPAPSKQDELLSSAAQAMDEERYLTPEDNNARDFYREVLALDAANPIALSGLRTISDVYVQQADTALRAGNPEHVAAALAIAAETDPENPAITIVDEQLLAQGNRQLADARLAAAQGDTEQAAELLSQAERYAHVDANEINTVRLQIAQSAQEQQFLSRLAAAEAHIAAGRLIAPAGDNAHAFLTELRQDYATDARLLASTESLGERLLTDAAFATAADRFTEATELLDAVEALGVLTLELAAVRTSLQRAEEKALDAKMAAIESAPAEPAAQSLLSAGELEKTSPPDNAAAELASLPTSSSTETSLAPAAVAGAGTIVANEPTKARPVPLSELAIEKYVAPRFPRRAMSRGLTGSVELSFSVYTDGSTGAIEIVHAEPSEIFVSSAENAVKQWRFAPRDDVLRARVKLRFEQQP